MEHLTYFPVGVCSRKYEIDYEGDKIVKIEVTGGCNGNLKGISSLLRGMKIEDAIERLEGITCGPKPTSCPDQISKALRQCLKK